MNFEWVKFGLILETYKDVPFKVRRFLEKFMTINI